ncbi:MAG: DUF4142 domain-containing protein [Kiritimatiellia bacterium]
MKTKYSTLLSTTKLALCGILLSAPYAMAAGNESLNGSDEKFIKNCAVHDMEEMKLAELAVQKANHPDVKAYAERIVRDHTTSGASLAALASIKGVELSGDTESGPTRTYRSLEKTPLTKFDKKFIDRMVRSHKDHVSNHEKASKHAEDDDVKAYANERLTTLRLHLEHATNLSVLESELSALVQQ